MPIRLDIKRKFTQRTDRVKGVELHPTEPWLLANLYNGNIYIWNHSDQSLVKSFEVTELPVRCSKFVPRKQWVVVGSDDMFVRVYNYNTMDRVKTWEAHTDYIRSLAVHPTLPYLLSSSDDMLIKLWDWDQSWQCMQIFEGHVHYVMQIAFNPKDTNTFASASLDRTIKVWSLGQPTPNFTLEGHEKGVNCVDYFQGGERPHLISGADDRTVKVWDYQTKACVQTLEGHGHNISAACFHPELPLIMTGSEDGTVRVWHSKTYRLETTLNYGMERVWALGVTKGSNMIAIGCDEGVALAKLGREEPVASMDGSGKIIWAKHNEIQTANIKSLGPDYEMCDGERLPLPAKDLGSCELYPQKLQHNPNGRFVAVCGDGEYIVYTALAWRNKCYGSALEFVWGADPSSYAIRQSSSSISIFHSFQEKHQLAPSFSAEGIFGGQVLGVKGQDMIVFYDWTGRHIVRRIDVPVSDVLWSDSGDLLTIVSDGSFYILRYHASVVEQHLASGAAIDEDGIEDAFELINEIGEKVLTGLWVGDCFIYTNAAWRLNYCVGNEITTLYHLDRHVYLLGYLAAQNRIYLIDKEFGVVSYTLLLNLIEYKTLVMRDQMEEADAILPTLPRDQMNSVARFLESKGHVEKALEVAVDPDYRFELAVQLRHLEVAQEIAAEVDSASKWKQLGELALVKGRIGIATGCLQKAGDLSGLLLIHSSTGDAAGMKALIPMALAVGKHNIAFVASLLLGQVDDCIDLLVSNGRASEAAFFARTYAPSRVSETVKAWQEDLRAINPKAAESLADPAEYPNMFPAIDEAMRADAFARRTREHVIPASHFLDHKDDTAVDLISLLREAAAGANGPDPGASDDYVQVDSALAEAGPDGDVAEETEEDYGMPELTGDSLGGEEGAADSLLQQDDVDEDLAWADSADADDGDVEELV